MSEDQNQFDPNNFQNNQSQEDLSTGLKVLSFCIPLAGAILYFTNKNESPKKAKSACTMALWGMALGIVINVVMTLLGVAAS